MKLAGFDGLQSILICFTLALGLYRSGAHGLKKNHMENETKKASIVHVEGVLGYRVELPCDIQASKRDDSVYMILWFKKLAGEPIFSVDVRGKGILNAKQWSSTTTGFGSRATFQLSTYPAFLLVHDLQMSDQGIFRCRVDFRTNPTKNSLVNLTVVVPPSMPVIYDSSGEELSSVLGPFSEGSDFLLRCVVRGGKPEPQVIWTVNGVIQQNTINTVDRYGEVISELIFRDVNRNNLGSTFSCRASNTKLVQPVEKTAILDLLLKPLYVRIKQKNSEKLIAGIEYRLICETAGSKPPAILRWIKGGKEITPTNTQEIDGGNVTVSTFLFVPSHHDNGESIICRTENPWLNRSHILEDHWNIDVVYSPIVKLSLGSTLNAMEIREGTDVYLECRINANPPFHLLKWFYNGEELRHNQVGGVIMSNQSLVLQGISRKKAAGNYSCQAINSQGSEESNPVFLNVTFSPVCHSEYGVTVGASFGETIGLRCSVESRPTAFRFEWEFHGARDNTLVDVLPEGGKIMSEGDLSRLFFAPKSDNDYGMFLCWATNDVGRQIKPCVFSVVVAVKPNPLENCTLVNQTDNMIHIECSSHREIPSIPDQPLYRIMQEDSADNPNQDPTQYGLFPEFYVMEVWDLKDRAARRNLSAETPVFILKNLMPGSWLRLVLYAANSHGKSEPFVIETVIAGDAEKQTLGASTSRSELFPLVAVGVGTALIGTILLLLIAIGVRARFCNGPSSLNTRSCPRITTNGPVSNVNGTSNGNGNGEKVGLVHGVHNNSLNSLERPQNQNQNNMRSLERERIVRNSQAGYHAVPQSKYEADSSNPDIIPDANLNNSSTFTYSSTVEYGSDGFQTSLSRKGGYASAYTSAGSPCQQLTNIPHTASFQRNQIQNLTQNHQQQNLGFPTDYFESNNSSTTCLAHSGGFNTIYIRDKLFHDSDSIPESCV